MAGSLSVFAWLTDAWMHDLCRLEPEEAWTGEMVLRLHELGEGQSAQDVQMRQLGL